MLASGGTVATLSQVRTWDTQHLTEAAAFWTKTATVWEDAFSDLAARISAPGGVPWEGEAAEAAQQLAYSDKMTVIGLADQLHSASGIAHAGVTEISEAQRLVLRVVDAAEAAGFTVGEDFSVSDPNVYDAATAAVRQAQAELLAADLRTTVGTLMAADTKVAGSLLTATAGLGKTVFPESGDDAMLAVPPARKEPNGTIQAVDFKQKLGNEEEQPKPDFGQCFTDNFQQDIGGNMIQGVLTGGLLGAARGGVVGIFGGPLGILGGAVVGFVGGAASGALISGPARTAVTSAWDCL